MKSRDSVRTSCERGMYEQKDPFQRTHRRGQSEAKKVGARAKSGPLCKDVIVFIGRCDR